MSTPLAVLVTGSLVHGGSAHSEVGPGLFLGRGQVKGVGYCLSQGAQRLGLHVRNGGDAWVGGELYAGTPERIARLDAVHGPEFTRKVVQIRAGSDGR